MSTLLNQIAHCVEFGKINLQSPFPPDMKGQPGADELAREALDSGVPAEKVLSEGLVVGMQKVGVKFRENKVFVPQVLMSAKSMSAAMEHLRPHFASGAVKRKGTVVMGTVAGDLHDIGKNLVSMMIEGGGWEVIDLGVDVSIEKFLGTIERNPECIIGLSALLTTTMVNMEAIVKEIKSKHPDTVVMVGGAPLTEDFKNSIGADFYSPDPQGAVDFLEAI
jgi:methanogenic corrinoid protein MtbC1